MAEFPINWQLTRTSNKHPMKNRYVSNLKISAEWSLVCLWSQRDPYKPEILEIHRNSTAKENLISVTLKLMRNGASVLRRQFEAVIEAGSTTTRIELNLCDYRSPDSYSMTGTLKIPANTPNNSHAMEVQFQTLIDLSHNFESLLDPNAASFSDLNVNCGTASFPAHKNILSARSPVFAAMFATQMKENRDNKVNITDLSPQMVKIMLTYIYCGKTGELSVQTASELLYAADKYQLDGLKRICSDYLKSCMSAENVLSTLILGELHDKALKDFAIDFICNSCEEFEVLEKTVEWKNLREKRPSLVINILIRLVNSKSKK